MKPLVVSEPILEGEVRQQIKIFWLFQPGVVSCQFGLSRPCGTAIEQIFIEHFLKSHSSFGQTQVFLDAVAISAL